MPWTFSAVSLRMSRELATRKFLIDLEPRFLNTLEASLRDAQEQILIDLIQMLKAESKATKSLRPDQLNAQNDA
jgi:hypothetical protein